MKLVDINGIALVGNEYYELDEHDKEVYLKGYVWHMKLMRQILKRAEDIDTGFICDGLKENHIQLAKDENGKIVLGKSFCDRSCTGAVNEECVIEWLIDHAHDDEGEKKHE